MFGSFDVVYNELSDGVRYVVYISNEYMYITVSNALLVSSATYLFILLIASLVTCSVQLLFLIEACSSGAVYVV